MPKIDKSVLTFGESPPPRDPDYIDWIREQPCIMSGYHGEKGEVHPAHIRYGFCGLEKPPDYHVLPLRHDLHRAQHDKGETSFWLENIDEHLLMTALKTLAEKMYWEWKQGS